MPPPGLSLIDVTEACWVVCTVVHDVPLFDLESSVAVWVMPELVKLTLTVVASTREATGVPGAVGVL